MTSEYGLYKGDDLLIIGTIAEIASQFKVKPATIKFYGSPAYQRRAGKKESGRRALVRLDDET
ncbi:hypothetical protein [Jeotgalibaca porci]|uniref:hypothetical protein n=1 Tax=Jeotgalibaca porci TaxID=1868793 RepID=UPI0035A04043